MEFFWVLFFSSSSFLEATYFIPVCFELSALSGSYVGSFFDKAGVVIGGFVAKERVVSRFEPAEDAAERGNPPGVFPAVWSEQPLGAQVSLRPVTARGSTRRAAGGVKRALFPSELLFCKHVIMLH